MNLEDGVSKQSRTRRDVLRLKDLQFDPCCLHMCADVSLGKRLKPEFTADTPALGRM